MIPNEVLSVDQIDFSDLEFWDRPWDVREGAYALLRRERPKPFFKEPDIENSAIPRPRGDGYRALMHHRDVAEVSRHPEIYRSGLGGAVSMIDMPDEMLEYFGGMINTDNPRHARLRRIVSQAFSPRMITAIEDSIERVTTDVIDAAGSSGGGDFVTEFAAPLP